MPRWPRITACGTNATQSATWKPFRSRAGSRSPRLGIDNDFRTRRFFVRNEATGRSLAICYGYLSLLLHLLPLPLLLD